MNENIRTYIMSNPKRNGIIILGIILMCTICIWSYIRADSHIDTKPIQRANEELRHAGEYNRQSVEYNQRIRTTVEHSQDVNERVTTSVTRSLEATRGTAAAIDRSTELVKAARTDAARTKAIIRESRNILESAKRDNQESTTTEPQQ